MVEICKLSDNGSRPIPVDLLWITPASIVRSADALCDGGPQSLQDFCSGLPMSGYERVHSIKLVTSLNEHTGAYQSWFQHANRPDLLTGGNLRDGYVCHGTDNTNEQITCTTWHPVDSELSVIASSMGVRGTTKAELLNQVQVAIDFTLVNLSR